ncbi:MAG: helix-turn-helix domain-containing protein [Bacteriovoracaceae bacterium]
MKPLRKNEIKVKIEKYLSKYLVVHDQQNLKLFETIKKSLGNRLTVKEVAIIEAFFKSADLSATRKTIVDHVWINVIVNPKTLDVHLYNLRKKLNEIGVSISINSPGCWQLFLGDMTDSKASNQDFLPSNS